MIKHFQRRFNIYSELCPASCATIIAAGLVTVTMGSMGSGMAIVLAGIMVGVATPLAKSRRTQKIIVRKHH